MFWTSLRVLFRSCSIQDLVVSFIGQWSCWLLLASPSFAGSNFFPYSANVYDLQCRVLYKFGQNFILFVKFESLVFFSFSYRVFIYFGWHTKQDSPPTRNFMGRMHDLLWWNINKEEHVVDLTYDSSSTPCSRFCLPIWMIGSNYFVCVPSFCSSLSSMLLCFHVLPTWDMFLFMCL